MNKMKAGYIAIIGRPNVGKSTLLNALVGEKISITAPKPQTTRMQILGIKTTDTAQMIFIDTPGLHDDDKPRAMNRYMNKIANASVDDADVIIWMIEAIGLREADNIALKKLKSLNQPVILVINKIDLLKEKEALLTLITKLKDSYPFAAIVPLCAKRTDSLQGLEKEIIRLLPKGEMIFQDEEITDKSIRFLAAEMIREKLVRFTNQELPYATTVSIEYYHEGETLIEMQAVIWVEREGQKAIVIGKGGALLKKIGTDARRDIEKLVDKKVFLRLWVRVKADWTDDERALKQFGYE